MLLSSVAAELALVGHGATLLSLEERNTAAARTCQVLPLVKQGLAALIIVMTNLCSYERKPSEYRWF
jgi:hypothetical protein